MRVVAGAMVVVLVSAKTATLHELSQLVNTHGTDVLYASLASGVFSGTQHSERIYFLQHRPFLSTISCCSSGTYCQLTASAQGTEYGPRGGLGLAWAKDR